MEIATPGPTDRIEPRVRPNAPQVRPQFVDRLVAARSVLAEHRQFAFERGDLATELVISSVEVGDQDGQVLRDSWAKPSLPVWARNWTTNSTPRTKVTTPISSWLATADASPTRPTRPPLIPTGDVDGEASRPRIAQGHRPGEGRHLDCLRLGERDADPVRLRPGPDEVDEPGRSAQTVVQIGGSEGGDLVRRSEVRGVDQQ